jgi:hypothetical protein
MKALILSLILSLNIAITANAKVQDFNSLISEDTKAQKELHSKLKSQVYSQKELEARKNIARTKKSAPSESIVFYDESQSTEVAAPSSDKFFRYKKELKQKSTNPRKNQHRVAKELKELGL